MRTFEIITIMLLFTAWVSYLVPKANHPRWLVIFPALAVLMAIVQLIVEQYRWQMVPAYTLAVILFISCVPQLLSKAAAKPVGIGYWIIHIAGIVLSFAAIVIATALPILFPVFHLPEPTGSNAVGTTSFEWVDKSRPELFTPEPDDYRSLFVQVWYPAEMIAGTKPLPMWPEAKTSSPLIAKLLGMPGFLFNHLELIQSHTYHNLPLAKTQSIYPVLVFSHAYIFGYPAQNLVQMEELASHGYVIFSIAHPYEAAAVIYPDGRVVTANRQQYKAFRDSTIKAVPILKQYIAATTPVDKERLFRQYLKTNSAQGSVKTWVKDTLFVLNKIEQISHGEITSLLSGHLDLNRVGILGHSMGGAVTGEVCMRDSRFKAGVNLDGIQIGYVIDGSIGQPFMMMYSTVNVGQNDLLYNRGHNQLYRLIVANTTHNDYCDLPLISPLFKTLRQSGSINAYRMETIINSYLLAFFDKYLRGSDAPLFNKPESGFPEVDLQIRNTD